MGSAMVTVVPLSGPWLLSIRMVPPILATSACVITLAQVPSPLLLQFVAITWPGLGSSPSSRFSGDADAQSCTPMTTTPPSGFAVTYPFVSPRLNLAALSMSRARASVRKYS